MPQSQGINLWSTAEHSLEYLRRADSIPHRVEGESALIEFVPAGAKRVLDLGTGAGRLISLLKPLGPLPSSSGLDFSPTMLDAARDAFRNDRSVTIVADFEPKLRRWAASMPSSRASRFITWFTSANARSINKYSRSSRPAASSAIWSMSLPSRPSPRAISGSHWMAGRRSFQ